VHLGHVGDRLDERERHVLSDDGSGLEETFVLGREPVDSCGEDGLRRRRNLPDVRTARLWRGPRQPIGPALPDGRLGFHESLDALLKEERIPFRPLDEQPLERLERLVRPQQRLEQFLCAFGRQRVDAQLKVVGPAPPRVLVLRAVVDEEQDAGRRQALNQAVEQRLGLAIDPVEILAKEWTAWVIPRWSHHHHLLGPVAGVSYRINERWSLKARYRAMAVDYQNGGFKLDAVSHGPVVGIGIHF
jgi:hypothetical protein